MIQLAKSKLWNKTIHTAVTLANYREKKELEGKQIKRGLSDISTKEF